MNQTDVAIQGFLDSMKTAGTLNTTAIVITAKHGQTPLNPAEVRSSRVVVTLHQSDQVDPNLEHLWPQCDTCQFCGMMATYCLYVSFTEA